MTPDPNKLSASDVGCVLIAVFGFLFFVGISVAVVSLPIAAVIKWVVS